MRSRTGMLLPALPTFPLGLRNFTSLFAHQLPGHCWPGPSSAFALLCPSGEGGVKGVGKSSLFVYTM